MATQPLPQQTTPVFAPDGTIARIPDQFLPDAMAHGGKLAVQMKTPDGALHFVPHDQVGAAQKAGGVVNTEQGPPDDPRPKEGFWHSLGAVFGITPEAMKASQEEYQRRGGGAGAAFSMSAEMAAPHPVDMVKSAATAVKNNATKAYGEAVASNEAAAHGDIMGFLAHQIGGMGYTGATVLAPLTGEAPAKAGEQFGEGNIKGGLGTTAGIIAPAAIDAGVTAAAKIPLTKIVKSAAVVGEPVPVVGPMLERLQRYKNAPAKLREIWAKQAEAEAGTTQGTAAGPVPGDSEPAPAPYRLSGDKIVDAKTATPKRLIGPERQLNAAPEETPAAAPVQPPKTSQVLKDAGVTQAMKEAGVAAPSASIRAVRPGTTPQLAPRADLSFPPGLTGEDAALMQLTRQNINELRFIAQKRGLPVSPKDTHAELIGKIHESLKPEEVQGFQAAAQQAKAVPSQFPENNLIADGLNKEAAELQAGKGDPYRIATLRNAAATVRQYPQGMAQVDFAATKIRGIDKGIRQRIGDMLTEQKAVPGGDDTVQTTAGQPMTILEAMRASLRQRGIKPPY